MRSGSIKIVRWIIIICGLGNGGYLFPYLVGHCHIRVLWSPQFVTLSVLSHQIAKLWKTIGGISGFYVLIAEINPRSETHC